MRRVGRYTRKSWRAGTKKLENRKQKSNGRWCSSNKEFKRLGFMAEEKLW